VDGQRQYRADQHAAEPDGWQTVQPDDDRGFVPGQRGTDRYGEPERYGEPDSRYADEQGRRQYGEPTTYGDPGYGDQQGYGEPDRYAEPGDRYDTGEQFADPNGPRRRRSARPARVGKRSGLDLPDAPPDDAEPEEPPRYRAEMIDRQALRRDAAPSYPAQAVEAFPAYAPAAQAPGSQSVVMPLQAPTQSIPSATPPAAVYLSRRPGAAALIGIVAAFAELLLLPVLLGGVLHHHTADVLGGIFAMTGVPMVALGLYALARGAVTAHGPDLLRAWLRPPLAYLPIGLVLILAAGMAL
jgi:hypothetical protein